MDATFLALGVQATKPRKTDSCGLQDWHIDIGVNGREGWTVPHSTPVLLVFLQEDSLGQRGNPSFLLCSVFRVRPVASLCLFWERQRVQSIIATFMRLRSST